MSAKMTRDHTQDWGSTMMCFNGYFLILRQRIFFLCFAFITACGVSPGNQGARLDLQVKNNANASQTIRVRTTFKQDAGNVSVWPTDTDNSYSVTAGSTRKISHFWPCHQYGQLDAPWHIFLDIGSQCFESDGPDPPGSCPDGSLPVTCDEASTCAIAGKIGDRSVYTRNCSVTP